VSVSTDQVDRELARLREVVARQADEIEVWRANDADLRGRLETLSEKNADLRMRIDNLKLELEEALTCRR
jgi:chromosome segregation ATPase